MFGVFLRRKGDGIKGGRMMEFVHAGGDLIRALVTLCMNVSSKIEILRHDQGLWHSP